MAEISTKRISSNIIWRLLERFGAQGVTFLVSVILARILGPTVYGTVALVTVFISILQVFVDSGMGNALIQKKDTDDLDYSSVFFFNVSMCCILYIVMFFASPFIAAFYEQPELTPVLRVLSIALVISGIKNVQQAYVSKNMLFKKFFFATLGGTIGAAILGIVFALLGFGVWALVAQHLFNLAIDTLVLWTTIKWHPKKMFSFSRLKKLFSFGWKMLVSALLDNLYNNIRSLLIGKIYSSEDLAFYNRGKQFPNVIITNLNEAINSVLFPVMSEVQDNRERIREMTRRAIKTSSYIMLPLMMGLAVCSEPLVRIVLTEKWLPSVFFLRIFCFSFAFYPIHTANLNAIKAMGRSDLFLKLEIIKKMVGSIALIATVFVSVEAMALSLLCTSIISQIVNSWPNRKLLSYRYIDQLKDMLPQILLSVAMGMIVYCVTFIGLNDVLTMLIQVPLGVLIYVGGSILFRIDSFNYVINIAKIYLKKEKKDENKA